MCEPFVACGGSPVGHWAIQAIQAGFAPDSSTGTGAVASCADAGGGCECEVNGTDITSFAGTYDVDGSTLVLHPADAGIGATIVYELCAQSNRLALHVYNPGQGIELERDE